MAAKLSIPKKTLRIPPMVELFGFRIRTVYDNTLLADRERYGEYCSRQMTITIDSNLSEQRKALTYCHELAEAVCDIQHLSLEESDKQAFGLAIHALIMQENILFAAITERDD